MHTWVKGQDWKTEDIRTLLCQLPGVNAAGVKFADDERMDEIEEIHILADTTRGPKQVVRDVQSALFAAFGWQAQHLDESRPLLALLAAAAGFHRRSL